jgi:hypothetical protein
MDAKVCRVLRTEFETQAEGRGRMYQICFSATEREDALSQVLQRGGADRSRNGVL